MALTPEQRALLELVHDRGLTYEEIGELTGMGADDARMRVRSAEAALGREGPIDATSLRRTPLVLLIALGGLVLLAGVLAVAGVFSEDDQQPSAPLATEPATGDQEVARIELSGAAGSEAQGSVVIGVGADSRPYLDLDLAGLEPSSGKGFHMLWVDVQGGRGVPLPDPIAVAGDGSFRERLTLSPETAGILELGNALEVVLTDRRAIENITREVTRAERTSEPGELDPSDLPRQPGEAVLRGSFPS